MTDGEWGEEARQLAANVFAGCDREDAARILSSALQKAFSEGRKEGVERAAKAAERWKSWGECWAVAAKIRALIDGGGEGMKKPKAPSWKVDSCADGSMNVYPPWKRAPGLCERLDMAAEIRRRLEAQVFAGLPLMRPIYQDFSTHGAAGESVVGNPKFNKRKAIQRKGGKV